MELFFLFCTARKRENTRKEREARDCGLLVADDDSLNGRCAMAVQSECSL